MVSIELILTMTQLSLKKHDDRQGHLRTGSISPFQEPADFCWGLASQRSRQTNFFSMCSAEELIISAGRGLALQRSRQTNFFSKCSAEELIISAGRGLALQRSRQTNCFSECFAAELTISAGRGLALQRSRQNTASASALLKGCLLLLGVV